MSHKSKLSFWRVKHPIVSTWLASIFLSAAWFGVWIIVFFVMTWVLALSTGVLEFFIFFMISLIAEAYTRYIENTRGIALFSKPLEPNPTGDLQDYSSTRAMLLFFQALILMVFVVLFFTQTGMSNTKLGVSPSINSKEIRIIQTIDGLVVLDKGKCSFYEDGYSIAMDIDQFRVSSNAMYSILEPQKCTDLDFPKVMKFEGQQEPSYNSLIGMLRNWIDNILHPIFLFLLILGILMRALMYKRPVYKYQVNESYLKQEQD